MFLAKSKFVGFLFDYYILIDQCHIVYANISLYFVIQVQINQQRLQAAVMVTRKRYGNRFLWHKWFKYDSKTQ